MSYYFDFEVLSNIMYNLECVLRCLYIIAIQNNTIEIKMYFLQVAVKSSSIYEPRNGSFSEFNILKWKLYFGGHVGSRLKHNFSEFLFF